MRDRVRSPTTTALGRCARAPSHEQSPCSLRTQRRAAGIAGRPLRPQGKLALLAVCARHSSEKLEAIGFRPRAEQDAWSRKPTRRGGFTEESADIHAFSKRRRCEGNKSKGSVSARQGLRASSDLRDEKLTTDCHRLERDGVVLGPRQGQVQRLPQGAVGIFSVRSKGWRKAKRRKERKERKGKL